MATDPTTTPACPICNGVLNEPMPTMPKGGNLALNCGVCGSHRISIETLEDTEEILRSKRNRPRIAHAVAKLQEGEWITSELIESWAKTVVLPGAAERLERLVLLMADISPPGKGVFISPKVTWARVGCESSEGAKWVQDEAATRGLIGEKDGGWLLTVAGWNFRDELLRKGARSTHAFMAMKYGDSILERVFNDHLQQAVKETGFDLRKANDPHQPAGSIDDTMRVDIRTSRFVICDLSHGNRGAYWEAGFAEGIGRPVIYMCEAEVLTDDQHEHHPHFDTRQQLIVPWDLADMAPAVKKLKAAIRATLPDEAKMEDG